MRRTTPALSGRCRSLIPSRRAWRFPDEIAEVFLRAWVQLNGFGRVAKGELLNPDDTLPPLLISEKEEVVDERTGAMCVHQEMVFGVATSDPTARAKRYVAVVIARVDQN